MTVTRLDYSAIIVSGKNIGVPVSGQVTLDETWAPHVQVSLTVPYTPAGFAAADPRNPRTVVFSAFRYVGNAAVPAHQRGFNLTLTGRAVDRARETLTITAASAETILQRATNVTPTPDERITQWQTTDALARNTIALFNAGGTSSGWPASKAIPIQVDSQNLIPNGSAEIALTGAALNNLGNIYARTVTTPYGTRVYSLENPITNDGYLYFPDLKLTPGRTYVASGTCILPAALATAGASTRARRIVTLGGSSIVSSTQAPNVAGTTRLSVTFTIPKNAKVTGVLFYHGHTSGVVQWDGLKVVERVPGDTTETAYWDGATPSTADYLHRWDGDPGISTSTRIALKERTPDSVIVAPGENYWDGLALTLAASGLRLFDSGGRLWRLVDETFVATGSTQLEWTDLLDDVSALDLASDAAEWCDGAIVRYRWRDSEGIEQERIDAYSDPNPSKVQTVDINAPFPGPGVAENIVKRAAGYLDTPTVRATANWAAMASQPLTITNPDGSKTTGYIRRVTFTLDDDTMTIDPRDVTLIPAP